MVMLSTGMKDAVSVEFGPSVGCRHGDNRHDTLAPNINLHLQGLSWNSSIRTFFTYSESI